MSEDLYLLTFQTDSNVLETKNQVFIKYPETYKLFTHYSIEILSNNSIISCQYIRYVFNEWRISLVLRLQLNISDMQLFEVDVSSSLLSTLHCWEWKLLLVSSYSGRSSVWCLCGVKCKNVCSVYLIRASLPAHSHTILWACQQL